MNFQPKEIYHIYNQGNNRQNIFHDSEDYACFLKLTANTISKESDIIAYCLMPNHFHFMVSTKEECKPSKKIGNLYVDELTNAIRKLLSGYCRITNLRHGRSGSLFRQKTKSKLLSVVQDPNHKPTDYYFNCFHYIHQNPLRAGLVSKLEDWKYSSFGYYAGLNPDPLVNKAMAIKIGCYQPSGFLQESYNLRELY